MSMISSEQFWACKLDANNRTCTWEYDDEDVAEHKLIVSQACLGAEAKDGERNVVNVTVVEEDDDEAKPQSHTIVSLRAGLTEQCSITVGFTTTVTFELVTGKGPVHLVGSHLMAVDDDEDESTLIGDRDDISLDDESEDVSSSEINSDIEDLGESVKEEESKQPVKRSKPVKQSSSGGKLLKTKEADVPSRSADNSMMIDQSDASEDTDEDSDDDQDEEESEEKVPIKSAMKKKEGKKSGKNVSFSHNVSVKTIPSKENSKTPSIEQIKASIINMKTPRPKTIQKLKNHLKATYKITDPAIADEVWKACGGGAK